LSGTVQVPNYPVSNRVPGAYAVVDATKANTATATQRTLLIGQMLASGTATAGQATICAGTGWAQTAFGAGSQLAIAVERYINLDKVGELWILPMQDAAAAAKATGSIAFTGAATSPAVLPLYVDGNYVPVSVNTGDTAATVATNTAAALNAWSSPGGNPLSWTAAATTGTVTLTARNAGSLPNSGLIMLSYRGPANGEGQFGATNVPGLTATLTQPSGGTTNPTVANALANLPAQTFDFIHNPYSDAASTAAVTAFLSDATGRWNYSSELFGGAFTAYSGTFSARTTWSTALNDQHTTAIGAYGSPNPDWHWSLDYCAAAAVSLRNNPAVPVGGLGGGVALNVLPPLLANQDSFSEQETLLYDGMSTYTVDSSGTVRIQRAITTYQKNTAGSPDNSYLDLNVPYQLAAYIRAWRTMITTNFNQAVLVSNGTRIPPGSSMVTPATIQFAIVAQYSQLATQGGYGLPAGIVSDATSFAADIVVTNAGGGVVTCLLPVTLSSQLIVVAADVQFTRV